MSFGGHRLWHAPEVFPRTYAPDFDPVEYDWKDDVLRLVAKTEPGTGIQKEIEISIQEGTVHLLHRLINHNRWAVELAPWALSVMAPGGRLVVPQEDYIPHPDVLAPARPLVVWHFTRMNDPRLTWGDRLIQMRQDSRINSKTKFGVLNTKGWAAYHLKRDLFVKTISLTPGGTYPDMGCNCEFFTMPGFLEVETLGPLVRLEPGAGTDHIERWFVIHNIELPEEEKPLIGALNPLLADMGFPTIQD
jgi:hypothetical protein